MNWNLLVSNWKLKKNINQQINQHINQHINQYGEQITSDQVDTVDDRGHAGSYGINFEQQADNSRRQDQLNHLRDHYHYY